MSQPHAEPRQFNPVAGLLACALPGLGHIYLGHRRRGLLIMFGVLFLFFGGLLIGGIDSVDRRRDHLWFVAQMLNGPVAFGTDYVNQRFVKTRPEHVTLDDGSLAVNPNGPLATTSLGRVNEMGTLFTALAGLMNLVVILDALFFAPPPVAADRRRTDA